MHYTQPGVALPLGPALCIAQDIAGGPRSMKEGSALIAMEDF